MSTRAVAPLIGALAKIERGALKNLRELSPRASDVVLEELSAGGRALAAGAVTDGEVNLRLLAPRLERGLSEDGIRFDVNLCSCCSPMYTEKGDGTFPDMEWGSSTESFTQPGVVRANDGVTLST